MAERAHPSNKNEPDVERSSEDIRQDIAKEKEKISRTVDQINVRINDKLDWREYVKDSPYWAIGAAAGLGYLAARVFMTRTTPMERIMGSIAGEVRNSLGGLIVGAAGPGLIKVTLQVMATKAAANWIRKAISTTVDSRDAGTRPRTGRASTITPEGEPSKNI